MAACRDTQGEPRGVAVKVIGLRGTVGLTGGDEAVGQR